MPDPDARTRRPIGLILVGGAAALWLRDADDGASGPNPVTGEADGGPVAATPAIPIPEGTPEADVTLPEADTAVAPDQADTAPAPPAPENAPAPEALAEEAITALETLSEPEEIAPDEAALIQRGPLSREEAAATYAATGIWQRAPEAPAELRVGTLDDLYQASLDPAVRQFDAVALPRVQAERGAPPTDPGLPPPPGLRFDFDDRGLVRATPDGALTPDGLRVFSGSPPVVPPLRREALPEEITGPPPVSRFRDIRPEARPADLIESRQRAILGGLTLTELSAFRPVPRPPSAQSRALAEAGPGATDRAVAQSLLPLGRPDDMAAIVARAAPREPEAPAPATSSAATATATATATVSAASAPNIPSTAEVARAATERNAVRLNRTALFGIYGTADNRRALVRLTNGNYEKVTVGDRLDGGRVIAIGETELRYQRGGRTIVLEMPRG
jgi:hypothetical protein